MQEQQTATREENETEHDGERFRWTSGSRLAAGFVHRTCSIISRGAVFKKALKNQTCFGLELPGFQLAMLLGTLAVWSASAQVQISEFAATGGAIADQDGDTPDWIEIYNAGSDSVNLAGWHLTDSPIDLTRWTFPATHLLPGGFCFVFASGKNRAVAGAELHTNFQLDQAGEYLALVKPDGQSIAHQFAPAYPPQIDGISYGLETRTTATPFVLSGAGARWHVPSAATEMPAGWTTTNFDHTAWLPGRTGLGYGSGAPTGLLPGTATNLARGKAVVQSSTDYGPEWAVDGDLGNFTHTAAGQNLPAAWEVDLGDDYALERIIIHNRTDCCGSRLRDLTVEVLSQDGTTTSFTSALLNPENVLGGHTLAGPANLTLDLTNLTGGLVFGGRVRVTRAPDPDLSGSSGQGNADEADVLSLAEVEVMGGTVSNLDTAIQTDLEAAMRGINASVLVRIPFGISADEMPAIDRLTLRMRYNDGFVAYLNGVEIARRNAPAIPVWNSLATSDQPVPAGMQFEDIDVSSFIGLLQEGENVLAIHGLNLFPADTDFLLLPELVGATFRPVSERYFLPPTPGGPNSTGYLGLVADTKFSVDRGYFSTPFSVEITTATPGAEIRYTTDGSPPSAVTGQLYTAPIPVSHTTVLRAIATKPGYRSSDVDTQTYVFLGDITSQSAANALKAGFPGTWANLAADYDMDPRIIGPNAAGMEASLRSLPAMFITTTVSNLFDPRNGIYSQPTRSGVGWERPASLELVNSNGTSEFQVNCGLRIQGGYFRQAGATHKHSFRVLFKEAYGTGRLRHNLFPALNAVQEFDTLVLRAGANDGYSWGAAKDTEQFTRDEFGRQLQLDMGHPAPHGRFVHLYLNGLYWGLYNLVERPNEDFSASYFGGQPEDWDANNAGDIKNGDSQAWNTFTSLVQQPASAAHYRKLQGRNPDGARNPAYPVYLDASNYIDYMIVNIWGGNWDWPNKNFWFGRNRTAESTGFKFYTWDFENTMGNDRSRSPTNMVAPRLGIESSWVGAPHYYLKNNPEYRLDFADRVHRFFFNGGLLTPQVLTNRYRALADSVELAILSESARWGDDNLNPPQDLSDWLRERDWILGTYLRVRSDIVLDQFRRAGLYPNVAAPVFSQLGGPVPGGYRLTLSNPNGSGTLYYTLDGADPRRYGEGTVGPSAQAYDAPLTLHSSTLLRARVLAGGQWSALSEAMFYPEQDLAALALTEIMYHPRDAGALAGDELEFIELKNAGTNTLDLSGLHFSDGITFAFTNGTTLAPGGFFVLARDAAAFAAQYPGIAPQGVYTGKLDNKGERLTLSEPLGATVFSITFGTRAPWPVTPDGWGFSLVPMHPGVTQAPDSGANWRASTRPGGSPGVDDPPPAIPSVRINEILANADPPNMDAIELFNPTDAAVDLGSWFLTDNPDVPRAFRVPAGTILPPGAYTLLAASQFGGSFLLSKFGESVYLFSGDAATNLTGYSHGFEFAASPNGISFGRHLTSQGAEHFVLQSTVTLGSVNAAPRVGPLVISEIMYHPPAGTNDGDDSLDEFIELQNITATNLPLYCLFTNALGYGRSAETNTWRLRNAIDYDFPMNLILEANRRLLVVEFAPTNAAQLAAFRSRYGIAADVPILGPWQGKLDNAGETIELMAPGQPEVTLANVIVPYVLIDKLAYQDQAPWPTNADGWGDSLQRRVPGAYGNDPTNWLAYLPTAGQPNVINERPVVSLIAPIDGAVFDYRTPIELRASASDLDGTVTRVEFWDDTVLLATVTNAPYTWLWSEAPCGVRALKVRAVDDQDAAGESAAVSLVVTSQPPSVVLANPIQGLIAAFGTRITLTATASDPDSTVTGVDFYADEMFLGTAPSAPYTWTWTAGPAGSRTLSVVARDETRAGSPATVSVFVQAVVANTTVLVPTASSWRYLDNGSDQGTNWIDPAFNDSTWSRGLAELGYGDGDEATVLGYGPNANSKPITYYFRNTFTLDSLAGASSALIRVRRDDGAVAYLNGQEIFRENLPAGPINYLTRADNAADDGREFSVQAVEAGLLRVGGNVLAVEIHQTTPNSTDISFDAELSVSRTTIGPAIAVPPQSQTVVASSDVQLTVEARGDAPLSYQWRRDGVALAGATTAMLILNKVQVVQAGDYTVVVSNAAGSVASAAAKLTVLGTAALRIKSVELVNNPEPTLKIHLAVTAGRSYIAQYRDSLSEGDWQTLIEITAKPGEESVEISDQIRAGPASRFYRILAP